MPTDSSGRSASFPIRVYGCDSLIVLFCFSQMATDSAVAFVQHKNLDTILSAIAVNSAADLSKALEGFDINRVHSPFDTTLLHMVCMCGLSPALLICLSPSIDYSLRDKVMG